MFSCHVFYFHPYLGGLKVSPASDRNNLAAPEPTNGSKPHGGDSLSELAPPCTGKTCSGKELLTEVDIKDKAEVDTEGYILNPAFRISPLEALSETSSRHMEWNANWNRWGATKGRKGKGKGREMKKDKGMKEQKEQAKGNKGTDAMASFPSCDTMPVSAQSQSSTSSSQPSELQTVMAALLEANPGLTLPPALLPTDAGQSMSRSKEEISSEQKRLNLRRKAITKLERP